MKSLHGLGFVLLLAACGGRVVVDVGGAGGGTTTTTGTGTTSTGTGGSCTKHDDCPAGLCIFATGTCAPACEGAFCESCTPGTVCDMCATSSCPACADCRAACVPRQPWQCDEDDPCPADQVCLFQDRICAPACSTDAECGGFAFCASCVTGSCCGCDDCVSACLGGE